MKESRTTKRFVATILIATAGIWILPSAAASSEADLAVCDNYSYGSPVAGWGLWLCFDNSDVVCGGGVWQDNDGDGSYDPTVDDDIGICIDLH